MRTTSSSLAALFVACLIGAGSTLSTNALAQSAQDLATARELYKQGKDLRAAGDLRGAADKFKAAHATAATPVTALEYGRAEMDLGHLVEARELFLSIARMKVEADESDKSAAARTEASALADKLKPLIPSITVKLSGLPPEATAEVKIDGQVIPAAAVGTPRTVNPGSHEVSAKAGDGKDTSKLVDVKEGESQEIVLSPPWVARKATEDRTPPPAPTVIVDTRSGVHPLVWVGAGIAIVGGAGGTVTALMANSKATQINQKCSGTVCPADEQQTIKDLQSSGKTLRGVSIGFFAFAAVGLGLAVTGFAIGGSSAKKSGAHVEPWIGHEGAGLAGTF